MSYFMTDEQSLLRDSVEQFCTAPDTIAAIQADTMQGGFPRRSWDKLAEAGFIGMSIPEEYGGQGQDTVSELIVNEVLGLAAAMNTKYATTAPLCNMLLGLLIIAQAPIMLGLVG